MKQVWDNGALLSEQEALRKRSTGAGKRKTQPGCSMKVDLSNIMLCNSPQHKTADEKSGEMTQEGVEDDEGEELFSHQKEAGNYGHETSVFVRGFYLF